ncbi:MAG TPA: UvrD-helicase domain-containing protein [Acidimicrobiia bacterium]|nr:UvrD-helicase domain-containing protein [Acidimicrobiia bacterium]
MADRESPVAETPPPAPQLDASSELAAEQRHLDAAYARLDAMRRSAERVAEGYTEVQRGGTFQARLEREAAEAYTRRRLASLEIGDTPLCFGRLDLAAPDGQAADGPFYVGRISVTDDDLTPLVIDWRAPVAEPFYRATAVEPMGVARRRHFQTSGRRLVGLDDEVFDTSTTAAEGLTVVGEGALLAALSRERTGRMHDIVATIQAEQDEAIRAPLQGALIVSGGPGTGKTAVALHRAAYLLYTYRKRLASQGVLLVGPSPIFLRYIDEVLPALGEDEVMLAVPASLKPRLTVRGSETREAATVKGDRRMAEVIAKALRDRERPMPRDVVAVLDGHRLVLRRRDSARIVERTRARRGTHNERRPFIVSLVLEHFRREYQRALVAEYRRSRERLDADVARLPRRELQDGEDVAVAAALARGERPPPEWDEELTARVRQLPEVRAALERMWPVLSGAELVNELFGFEALIRSAAGNTLTPTEQRLLFRERSTDLEHAPWTDADLALIDEADGLLGSPASARPRSRRRNRREHAMDQARRTIDELGVGASVSAAQVVERYGSDAGASTPDDDEPRTFGHVIVDEAQDLTAMQWRMLARRCPSGSMTLVGDFGQASRPGALSRWDDVLAELPNRTPPQLVGLSVNYRTPAEIMEFANQLLPAAAPGVDAAQPVRSTGAHPVIAAVDPAELTAAAAAAAARAADEGGTVAVIAPLALHAELTRLLAEVGAVSDSLEAIDAAVAVLTPLDTKGLEFDHVVVVEPSRLVDPDRAGLRLLYVVLTRATRSLTVVHADPLPEALGATSRSEAQQREANQREANQREAGAFS